MIVYFDGTCPLCRAEIAYYRRQEGAIGLCFRDVSQAEGSVEPDLLKGACQKPLFFEWPGISGSL
jgi:predicted DCC family thiol-disulfide oxidoreductase YuxK